MGWFDTSEPTGGVRSHANAPVGNGATLYARWLVTPNDFILGDTNGDGRVTSADASRIARWIIEPSSVEICLLSADINGDGEVNITDVIMLARWLVGLNVDIAL